MAQSDSRRSTVRGEPAVAVLLTWFLPGAGHVYLGRPLVGLIAFAILNGLYWLGLDLSHGMSFEWLDPELRSRFAVALSPEAGNLGAIVYQMKSFGFGTGYPRPFPDTARLGSALCALSGILNLSLMTHAHTAARMKSAARAWPAARAVLWTSLLPGLGHFLQGRRKRALVIFLALLGLFALGTVLADSSNLSRERHFYYYSGQLMLGLAPLASEALWGAQRITAHIPYVEAGLGFGCVAGLLNVMAMIDAFAYEADAIDSPAGSAAEPRTTPFTDQGEAQP